MYEVILSHSAQKQLDRLSRSTFAELDAAIQQLRNNPRPHGVKKLRDRIHRIRVGDYRIIYSIVDADKVILISKVARRTETTYTAI